MALLFSYALIYIPQSRKLTFLLLLFLNNTCLGCFERGVVFYLVRGSFRGNQNSVKRFVLIRVASYGKSLFGVEY